MVRLLRKDRWAWVVPDDIEALEDKLTLTSAPAKGFSNRTFTVQLFERDGGILGVPRAMFPGPPDPQEWPKAKLKFKGKLRNRQRPIVEKVIRHFADNCGGIVKATTGSGKTVMGLYIAAALGYRTLVVVPTQVIMKQWVERARQFLGIEAGIIRQHRCQVGDITVAMIHSLARRGDYGLDPTTFGLVIFDEVHITPAETFAPTVPLFNPRYRLGLSATPRRKDGLEDVFKWHIGEVVYNHTAKDVVPSVLIVNYYSPRTSQVGCTKRDGSLMLGRYFNKVASDQVRNKIIAKLILQAYNAGREILVLSDRLNQLDVLEKLLLEGGVKRADIGYQIGSKKQPDRRVLLATYKCAGLGFDKPSLDTMVMAMPRSDIEQAVGRLMRIGSKKQPLVIDIVDVASPEMLKWSQSRRNLYYRFGCGVKIIGGKNV